MKKITFLFLTMLFYTFGINAQCIGTYEYVDVSSVNDGSLQVQDGCNWGGDWNNITDLVIGQDYEFSSEIATDYITFTDDSNNIIAYGQSPLAVPAITVASGRFHIYADNTCTGDETCRETYIQCTTCTPAPVPDCAETPITPADGSTTVPAFDIFTLSWTAPSTGPTPTSYDIYVGTLSDGSDMTLFTNVTETSIEVTVGQASTTLYWMVIPVNETSEASGCAIWGFTTDAGPAVPPNDNVCNATALTMNTTSAGNAYYDIYATSETNEVVGSCFNGGIDGSVWFSFVAPASGSVQISTDVAGGTHEDTELAVYEAPSNCADASSLGTELGCSQDITANYLSTVEVTGLTEGTTYYVQIDRWGGSDPGYFGISIYDLDVLSTENIALENESLFNFYPNPVNSILTLKASAAIQNVTAYNMLGQIVINNNPNSMEKELDMSMLQAGTYFVKVTVNNTSKTIKIIKE
ncbi:T9SS type A sorting domain-containing protein [Flavobacterium sp.]|uniref:T9SS type A sorting domain-containing protein n=1 Tax=Flavobacterium sp. TaxID=239 RepID=UPI003527EBB0